MINTHILAEMTVRHAVDTLEKFTVEGILEVVNVHFLRSFSRRLTRITANIDEEVRKRDTVGTRHDRPEED
jgi:hypothetical protein